MTPEQTSRFAKHIMRLLKVRSVSFPIALTDKGPLSIKYTKDIEDYEMVLDAVPLSVAKMLEDENNIELKQVLEKYLFAMNIHSYTSPTTTHVTVDNNVDYERVSTDELSSNDKGELKEEE